MFRKKKLRVSSTFFTKSMRDNLNAQIDKISKVIMGDSIYENYFPTFNEFVGEDRDPGYFESFKDIPNRRSKPVNVIISDFQPIHNGHIKSAQRLFDDNGLPCLLACIHSGTTSKVKPFKSETVANGLLKLVNQNPSFIAGYVIVPDGEIESLLKIIKPDYEPAIIASTKSRIRDLALQLELAKKRSRNLNLKKNLRLVELPNAGIKDEIMSTVKNGDYSGFKSSAPAAIHSEFHNMNRDLTEQINESKIISVELPIVEVDDSDLILESIEISVEPLEAKAVSQQSGYSELTDIGLVPEIIAVSYKWNPQRAENGGARAIAKDYGVTTKFEASFSNNSKNIILTGPIDNIKGFLEDYAFPDLDSGLWEEGVKDNNGNPIKLYELPADEED